MIISFNTEYIPILSIEEAILYSYIEYLCIVNKSTETNYFNGIYWVDANYSCFARMFTFWTIPKIKEMFDRMVGIEVVTLGVFNQDKYCLANTEKMRELLSGKIPHNIPVSADESYEELTWKSYEKKTGINYKSVPNRRDVKEYIAVIDRYNEMFGKKISLTNTNYRLISQAFANGHTVDAIMQAFKNRPLVGWTKKYWKESDFPSMFYQKNSKGDPVDWVDTFAGENFSSNKQDLQKELQEVINWFKILHDLHDSDRVRYFATVKYPVWSVDELKGCSGDYDLITESIHKLYNAYQRYINLIDT